MKLSFDSLFLLTLFLFCWHCILSCTRQQDVDIISCTDTVYVKDAADWNWVDGNFIQRGDQLVADVKCDII